MTITINDKEIIVKLEDIKNKSKDFSPMLYRIGALLEGQIKTEIQRQKLIDQRGLLNSIRYRVKPKELEIRTDGIPYAVTHEFGTVGRGGSLPDIRPRNVKNLTIPFREYKNISARSIYGQLEYVRFRDSAFLRDKNKDRLAYMLVQRARFPAKPFFFSSIKMQQENIIKIIREEIAGD